MLDFPKNYFNTEKRDGFVVNELMKRTWAAQLEVLHTIIEICNKHNITYYAYYGTLLGAVRHKGFIPWDDDLDIAMKRDDYIKFLEVARWELPEKYCILNSYTESEHMNVFTRITNEHGIDFSDRHLEQYHGCPFVVGVDIFPLYYIPRDSEQVTVQNAIVEVIDAVTTLVKAEENETTVSELLHDGLRTLEDVTGYRFTTERPLRNQLTILYDKIGRLFEEDESDILTVVAEGHILKKEWLEESVQIPFENIMVKAPKGYDEVLEELYPNYMIPRIERDTHDYPFYKDQLAILGREIEKQDCDWKKQQNMQLPQGWQNKIKGKRVVVYHTSAEALMRYNEFVADKLRNVFQMIRNEEDVVLWWCPCLLDTSNVQYVRQITPQLVTVYGQIMDEFRSEGWGVFDVTGDWRQAVDVADFYYGDESGLAQLFRDAGKNVLIQDYENREVWK